MHHFFIDKEAIKDRCATLSGDEAHHLIHVLRVNLGEEVLLSDGTGTDYVCEVEKVSAPDLEVILRIRFQEEPRELPCEIYLFQALPKHDRMELVVQKAVELGVHQIIPLLSANVVVRLDEQRREGKRRRWQAVAEAAAKQSKRSVIPWVRPVTTWKEALKMVSDFSFNIIPYENADGMAGAAKLISELKALVSNVSAISKVSSVSDISEVSNRKCQPLVRISLFIGPEGGFREEEIMEAEKMGFRAISLGKRILRTETAAICAMSILMFAVESAVSL